LKDNLYGVVNNRGCMIYDVRFTMYDVRFTMYDVRFTMYDKYVNYQ